VTRSGQIASMRAVMTMKKLDIEQLQRAASPQ
jgi:hypothetical protein